MDFIKFVSHNMEYTCISTMTATSIPLGTKFNGNQIN